MDMISTRNFRHSTKPFFISYGSILKVKGNYPKVKYSKSRILKDTKNILYQNFVEKYSKQMQVVIIFVWWKFKR
jgi:hypothetical protein